MGDSNSVLSASSLAWHFLSDDCRMRDGTPVVVGETYRVEGELALCSHGLHYSRKALDALQYAPGAMACRVEVGGSVIERDGDNKGCCSERKVLAIADSTPLLHDFACWCAERALKTVKVEDRRCWEAIEVKRKWLKGEATDEELAAARDAARDAARAAARDAAWAAAWAAAWDAAWAAARDAAWDAAWDAQNEYLEQKLSELLGVDSRGSVA